MWSLWSAETLLPRLVFDSPLRFPPSLLSPSSKCRFNCFNCSGLTFGSKSLRFCNFQPVPIASNLNCTPCVQYHHSSISRPKRVKLKVSSGSPYCNLISERCPSSISAMLSVSSILIGNLISADRSEPTRRKVVHVHVGQFVRLVVRTVVAVHTARGQHFRRSCIWSRGETKGWG